MKRILKSFVFKFGGNLAALALMVTVLNVNAACFWYCHQPELPEGQWNGIWQQWINNPNHYQNYVENFPVDYWGEGQLQVGVMLNKSATMTSQYTIECDYYLGDYYA